MRTVLYARFSSHLQNSRSIDDQIALLRERADREGWPILDIFTDYAISGAAGIEEAQRPGLNALLSRVEAGGVDQVLAESTDRMARHQGDAFMIRERIRFAGARLFTLSDGEVTDITVAFKGLMDARFRDELGAKVRRGQRGAVNAGRAPAGLAYGYRSANRIDADGRFIRGLREIDEDQAAIVRRIFIEFAEKDRSTRAIAEQLNKEGVPGPSGGKWRASTIGGDRQRQNGILQNRLYAGVMVVNRTSKVVDPRTRKAKIRPNPESEWISQPVPALRIIDDALFERALQRRQSHSTGRPETQRRPKHMLSGLAVCGVCGGGYNNVRPGYWGCGKYRDGRACTNNRTITSKELEDRVVDGLQRYMLNQQAFDIYLEEYLRERKHRMADEARERGKVERQLADATARVLRLVEAVAAGGDSFAEIREVLEEARATRDRLQERLNELEAVPALALHPTIIANYRAQVEDLSDAMNSTPERKAAVLPKIRSLIERVVIYPILSEYRGVTVELEGRLAAIVALATGQEVREAPSVITMERVRGIEPL